MRMMKTNKIYIAAATLALGLAACSEQADFTQADVINAAVENADRPVQFSTYLGEAHGNTRAYTGGTISNSTDAAKGTTQLTDAEFGVFAYYTETSNYSADHTTTPPNFMFNEHMTWSTSSPANKWIYSPVKYWPNGNDADNASSPSNTAIQTQELKLSFFSFAPYTATPSTAYNASSDGAMPSAIANEDYVKKNDASKGVVAMTNNGFGGNVWVKYKMGAAADASTAVDLLWGLAGKSSYDETDGSDPAKTIGTSYNVDLTKQKVGETVKFLFKHALAKVGGATTETEATDLKGDPEQCGFKVVVDVDNNETTSPETTGKDDQRTYFGSDFSNEYTLVTLKRVEIRDGASAANHDGVADGTTSDLNTSGWFNIETGSWDKTVTASDGTARYSVIATSTNTDNTDAEYTLNEKIKEVTTYEGHKGTQTSGAKYLLDGNDKWDTSVLPYGVTTTPTNVFAKENVPGLLVIPGGTGNTLYITVEYVVRTADKKLDGLFTAVTQTITNKVSLADLDPNKYYTIIMHLGLTSVKFEAVVTDWATTAGATYDEDGNVTESGEENTKVVWLPSNVINANSLAATIPTGDFSSDGGDKAITDVKLNGGDALVYAAAAAEGKYAVSITGGDGWLTETSGTLTATKNYTNQPRSATVTISTLTENGTTVSYSEVVTQAADATYTLTPDPIKIARAANSATTITVTGGTVSSLTATTTPTGLTAGTPAAPSITYTATAANNSGADKEYKGVVITINDGTNNFVYTTTITQSGI